MELREKIAREARIAGKMPGLWTEGELAKLRAKPPTIAELDVADAILALPEVAKALEAQAALVRADLVVHEGELNHLIRPDNA